jgi:hypothetical protein
MSMTDIERMISDLPGKALPAGLARAILARIARAEALTRLVFGALSAASAVVATAGVWSVALALAHSGFVTYASLIFSDTGLVVTNIREFALTLAESVPIVALALSCAGLIGFLASARRVMLWT